VQNRFRTDRLTRVKSGRQKLKLEIQKLKLFCIKSIRVAVGHTEKKTLKRVYFSQIAL
jgi:hypothetical protein